MDLNCQKYVWLMICLSVMGYGCTSHDKSEAKAVWVSPSAEPQDKIKAATVLIPTNASPEEVREILGSSGKWRIYHHTVWDIYDLWQEASILSLKIPGQKISPFAKPGKMYTEDRYYLEYPAYNGCITIEFQKISPTNDASDYRFSHVGYSTTNFQTITRSVNVNGSDQSKNTNITIRDAK